MSETDILTRLREAERNQNFPNVRPKDAATLIIIDERDGVPHVLMGRRHMRHKFMPGMFVFPGGRLDPNDGRVPYDGDLTPVVMDKLLDDMKGGPRPFRARALALCAIRETYEEAGLFIGQRVATAPDVQDPDWVPFYRENVVPDLSQFTMIARAITPPRRPRRFDTRFFATTAASIAHALPEGTGPSGELEDLHWLPISDAKALELPTITQVILEELERHLSAHDGLNNAAEIPYYYVKGGIFHRYVL